MFHAHSKLFPSFLLGRTAEIADNAIFEEFASFWAGIARKYRLNHRSVEEANSRTNRFLQRDDA
jgi:hypothetical protein